MKKLSPKYFSKEPIFPKVDEAESIKMIRYAIDHGLNYIDAGYFYHGGESEKVITKALKGDYRDKVKIATKLPVYLVEKKDDFDRFFNERLERLETDKMVFLSSSCAFKSQLAQSQCVGDNPMVGRIGGKSSFSNVCVNGYNVKLIIHQNTVKVYNWHICLSNSFNLLL